MECWQCERPAQAVCRFCGRAVCKEHAQTRAFVLEIYRGRDARYKGLTVADVIWCGLCQPQDDPIVLKLE